MSTVGLHDNVGVEVVANKKPAPKFGGVRTGGRSALVVEKALSITVTLLGEVGYGALRIEEVAERSGINKTTIYRRWPTKAQLVTAALRAHKVHEPPRDTGDLEADLTEMYVDSMCSMGLPLTRGIQRMLMLEQQDKEVVAIRTELRDRVIALRMPRLQRAVARGELPPGTDLLLLLEMIGGAIYSRLLSHPESPSPEVMEQIVRTIVAGARAVSPKAKTTRARRPSKRS